MPDRFAVKNYVPPEPHVQFADRVHRTPEERAADHRRHRRKQRRRAIIGWLMLVTGVAILAAIAWVGWRSYQAYSHLETASAEVSTLQDELKDVGASDPAAAADTVSRLQDEAAAARSAVEDPVLHAATVVPLLGGNLHALREVALTVDSLATNVMPSLVDVAQTLQPAQLAPDDGAIDLAPIQRISPLLQDADSAVTQARERMAAIDLSSVVQPVGEAVISLENKLGDAGDVTGPAARISRLLPTMLGSDGPRSYLVVFQNPAELRATGGIFGSFALVTADQGKITIGEQGASSRVLGYFDPPVAKLTPNQIKLYTELMAQYPQDVNFTPDFPTAAPLFAEMYRVRTGETVDGVLAIDPVALSYTLKGSTAIDVGDGVKVTSDNLVSILLSTAYKKFDSASDQSQRDAFLAAATATVFTDLMSGEGKPASIINGLRKAVDERRVLLYSADPAEQADIAPTGVSGALTGDPMDPSIGVFMNDGTAAKLGYYLRNAVHVVEGSCRDDGRRELEVRITMTYDPPARGLPEYVTGNTDGGEKYELQTNVLVFAPAGGGIVSATRDDEAIAIGRGEDLSREVGTSTVVLKPGKSTELVFTVLGPAGGTAATDVNPALIVTPGVKTWDTSVDPYRVCRPPSS
ncbi:DUF4012 domain-containing protein [Nakamurella sp. GG22]